MVNYGNEIRTSKRSYLSLNVEAEGNEQNGRHQEGVGYHRAVVPSSSTSIAYGTRRFNASFTRSPQ